MSQNFTKQFKPYIIENYGYIRLPKIDISKEQKDSVGVSESASNFDFLLALTRKGFKQKQSKIKKEHWKAYGDRVKYEMSIFDELGFIDYILLVWIVCNKADELGVWRDFGRGSVAGSAVCWFLGISGVDPIDKKLFFERFVSKVRAGKKIINGETYLKGDLLADVDLNLGNGREEIVKWLNQIYPNRVSKIINFSTLTTKILLKDVSKIYSEYSEDQAKEVSDLIGSKFGVVQEIEDAYKENEKFKKWADENKDIVSISQKLSGLLRQTSIHASGYLVSYFELTDIVPLERSKEGDLVSGYDMRQISNFATKLDLLGLTTNGIIKDVLNNIPEKIEEVNLDNDPIIYDQYQNNTLLPYGLYQISAHCAYGVLNKVKPKNIEELSDVNSLARPGSLAYVDSYVKGDAKCLTPLFEPVLKGTRNVVLFQEQLMQLAVVIGFTLDDAEIIRKIVGKKDLQKVKEWKVKIYKKVEEKGFSKEIADAYWKVVNESASYSFNKCCLRGTLVQKENHLEKIENINTGDRVYCIDFNGNKVLNNVINVYKNNVEVFEFELSDGRKLKCSMNHKVMTPIGMVPIKECIEKDLEILCENEFLKEIPEYLDYKISNYGNIYSFKSYKGKIPGTKINPYTDEDGYLRIQLCKNNKRKKFYVQRLVAITFLQNPENKETVNHKDGNKKNNFVENLEWATYSENNNHACKTGLNTHNHCRGENSTCAILNSLQVSEIKYKYKTGNYTQIGLGNEYGVSRGAVYAIVKGLNWKHLNK